ncbi:hypothetical protein ON010_g2162 [Phytophthora cinnamomi]|nr:hypothetical protein ON010_g2162 [Phytophthora cinnamomi]
MGQRTDEQCQATFRLFLTSFPAAYFPLAAGQLGDVPKLRRGAEFHEHQAAILLRCREALAEDQERMRDIYDRNRMEQVIDVGDRVYLSTQHLDLKHTELPDSSKFGPKWIVPYTIVRKIQNHAYELNIEAGNKLHPVFNTGSLLPYKDSTRLSRPNEAILADGGVDQIVKRLLGKRRHKQCTQYLVEWVGEEKQTWEPIENLSVWLVEKDHPRQTIVSNQLVPHIAIASSTSASAPLRPPPGSVGLALGVAGEAAIEYTSAAGEMAPGSSTDGEAGFAVTGGNAGGRIETTYAAIAGGEATRAGAEEGMLVLARPLATQRRIQETNSNLQQPGGGVGEARSD